MNPGEHVAGRYPRENWCSVFVPQHMQDSSPRLRNRVVTRLVGERSLSTERRHITHNDAWVYRRYNLVPKAEAFHDSEREILKNHICIRHEIKY